MKIYPSARISVLPRCHSWSFTFFPTIGIRRDDFFYDEACHIVFFHWLVFVLMCKIVTKKKRANKQ